MTAPTTLKDVRVKRFSPTGTSDSLDATDEFPGACSALSNLVPDTTTRNLWTCRPGVNHLVVAASIPGITTPGNMPVFKVVGDLVAGLCSDLSTGTDKPFAYNLLTNAFVAVTMTGPSFPNSTIAAGAPLPTIDLIGTVLCITHPNYPLSSTGCAGAINVANPAAPVYTTGDLTGGVLSFVAQGAIPTWVRQFNQRANWGVNPFTGQPSMIASDDLVPFHVTNAGQALTFGNNLFLTAAAPLGLSNQLGGIVQSLMVFQGQSNIQQVTGDFALSTWAVNSLNIATGTLWPRSICSTPLGLAFLSPRGMRIIDQDGNIGDPIGVAGSGVVAPFIGLPVFTISTVAAGCDGETLRVAVSLPGGGTYEYWYSLPRKVWSGPHSPFAAWQIDVWRQFFMASAAPVLLTTGLYASSTIPSPSSSFSELGVALGFTLTSASLEDNNLMAESEMTELQIVASSDTTVSLSVELEDGSTGTQINTSTVAVNRSGLYPFRVDFSAPSVFNRLVVSVVGISVFNFRIGDFWMRLRTLAYIINNS